MDQRSLIEVHLELSADGWQIQVEMTGKTRKEKVCSYRLTHPELLKRKFSVSLTYPIASESGRYELVSRDKDKIVSSIS